MLHKNHKSEFISLLFDHTMQGKMELEFEIVSEEEAQLRPAGKGREDPNMNPVLDPPK